MDHLNEEAVLCIEAAQSDIMKGYSLRHGEIYSSG